jgi:hypothetical protein
MATRNKFLLYGGSYAQETKEAMTEAKRRSIYSVIPPISRSSAEAPIIVVKEAPVITEDGSVSVVAEVIERPKIPEAPKIETPKPTVRRQAGEILANADLTTMRKRERLRRLGAENPGNEAIIDEAIKKA